MLELRLPTSLNASPNVSIKLVPVAMPEVWLVIHQPLWYALTSNKSVVLAASSMCRDRSPKSSNDPFLTIRTAPKRTSTDSV